ncbi:hypothetical protein B8W90_13845, partial [Staphylococcus hominis]
HLPGRRQCARRTGSGRLRLPAEELAAPRAGGGAAPRGTGQALPVGGDLRRDRPAHRRGTADRARAVHPGRAG